MSRVTHLREVVDLICNQPDFTPRDRANLAMVIAAIALDVVMLKFEPAGDDTAEVIHGYCRACDEIGLQLASVGGAL